MTTPNIHTRLELSDLPQDSLNQISGIRQRLVQLRNSARLSPSKAAKLRETLKVVLDSLTEPSADPEVEGAPTAPVQTKKPAQKTTGSRRATARIKKEDV